MTTYICQHTDPKPWPTPAGGEPCAECEAQRDAWAADMLRLRPIWRLYAERHFEAVAGHYEAEGTTGKARALAAVSAWSTAAGGLATAHGQARTWRPWFTKGAADAVRQYFERFSADAAWCQAIVEDVRRRLEDAYDGPLPEPLIEDCPDTFVAIDGIALRCTLPRGHGGAHALEPARSSTSDPAEQAVRVA